MSGVGADKYEEKKKEIKDVARIPDTYLEPKAIEKLGIPQGFLSLWC